MKAWQFNRLLRPKQCFPNALLDMALFWPELVNAIENEEYLAEEEPDRGREPYVTMVLDAHRLLDDDGDIGQLGDVFVGFHCKGAKGHLLVTIDDQVVLDTGLDGKSFILPFLGKTVLPISSIPNSKVRYKYTGPTKDRVLLVFAMLTGLQRPLIASGCYFVDADDMRCWSFWSGLGQLRPRQILQRKAEAYEKYIGPQHMKVLSSLREQQPCSCGFCPKRMASSMTQEHQLCKQSLIALPNVLELIGDDA